MNIIKKLDEIIVLPYLVFTLCISLIFVFILSNSEFVKNNQKQFYCSSIRNHNSKLVNLYYKNNAISSELLDFALLTNDASTEYRVINSILMKTMIDGRSLNNDVYVINSMCQTFDKEDFVNNLIFYSRNSKLSI